jgi:hypothetical protein
MFDKFYVLKENLMIYNLVIWLRKLMLRKKKKPNTKRTRRYRAQKFQNFHSPNQTLKVITLTAKLKRTPKYKLHY